MCGRRGGPGLQPPGHGDGAGRGRQNQAGARRRGTAATEVHRPGLVGGTGPVTRDDMTAQAIADAMGARDASGLDLAESLAARIADYPALIVLDNCEHLATGCREVAERLLTSCPRLHILATSREPLGAGGESRWPLPPLTVPRAAEPPGAWPGADQAAAPAPPPAAP